MQKEVLRQLIHASGIFIVVLSYFISPMELIVLCVGILILVVAIFKIDQRREVFFFSKLLKNCKREHDERGFIYFFIGIILTLYFFRFNLAIADAAILILLFGDSISTLVGRKYGRIKLPYQGEKTLEGSLAFLMVGLPVALTQLPLLPSFLGTVAGAFTEAYSPIDDNITVPLVAGLVMSLALYPPL